MANQHIPNDPYDPYRSGLSDEVGRPSRFDACMRMSWVTCAGRKAD